MTFIQPNKNRGIINSILTILALVVLGSTFWLIALYNSTVNLSHAITTAKAQVDAIGAENTTLSHEIVATLGSAQLANVVRDGNLVEEQKPQYFSLNQSWHIASQQ